jgi:hypothetical protein
VSVEVKYKAIAGSVDQAGGIVLRYRPENYYIARANALEDNIDLFKTVDGKRLKLAEFPIKVTGKEWHTLGFTAKGAHLTVTFDGKVAGEADDTTFPGPGKVGLWTKGYGRRRTASRPLQTCGSCRLRKERRKGVIGSHTSPSTGTSRGFQRGNGGGIKIMTTIMIMKMPPQPHLNPNRNPNRNPHRNRSPISSAPRTGNASSSR